jgi:alpha-mannosidase
VRTSRLRVEPDEIIVTAFKPGNDGKTLIARLYNVGPEAVPARLAWSAPAPSTLWRGNLWEQRGEKIGGPVEVPPQGFVTVIAEMTK